MTNLLEEVLRSGTAAGVRARYNLDFPAAGKTGTSHDGWFAGYTSELLCVVWVGFDDNRELDLEGAHSAAPIWAEFMKRALQYPRVPRHQAFRIAGRHRVHQDRSAIGHARHAQLPHYADGGLHRRNRAGGRVPAPRRALCHQRRGLGNRSAAGPTGGRSGERRAAASHRFGRRWRNAAAHLSIAVRAAPIRAGSNPERLPAAASGAERAPEEGLSPAPDWCV